MSGAIVKGLASLLAASAVLGGASAAQAAQYIDYWGDDLFLGLAFHRFGCHTDDANILSNQEYDGFTTNDYCFSGQAWSAPELAGYFYLESNETSGAAQLNTCGEHTNQVYGTPNYAAKSSQCSYNIMTNCNSDCWISEFSFCQGMEIAILSPCF